MTDRGATPVSTLEKIYKLAKDLGLRFPYLGNVYNNPYENTYCPVCGTTLIERQGFSSRFVSLDNQQCGNCGEKIEIIRHVS
jgi:pyruvate formate lyase activating enzyme